MFIDELETQASRSGQLYICKFLITESLGQDSYL